MLFADAVFDVCPPLHRLSPAGGDGGDGDGRYPQGIVSPGLGRADTNTHTHTPAKVDV